MVKPTRKERDRQRHRAEILAAAQGLFARKGFDRTSMAEVAEQAEFAVGTLYKFFKDKESLYRALILSTVQEVVEVLVAALESRGTEHERLERYIEAKAEMFVRHIPTARLYFAQTAGAKFVPTAGFDRDVRDAYQVVLDLLEAAFRSGMRKGIFLKADPKALALGLEGVSNAFLDEMVERPDDYSADTLANLTKTIFFERIHLKPT